ncbi:multiple antibiotic resistance protein [Mesorhizobium soli]|uniref:MarC family protein n=1 Tax=Pseudaminobacter soli (ex Li et al. 2025) TaxID=1295366 RepID=UPI0024749879|nr:MarC family protein [Mesorhizobium soli]MDH6234509.1 multiple antibiotic resistance protein [Mesorhizobium soli]
MEDHLQAIVTLISLVNPMVCAMMFTGLTAGRTRAQRVSDATRAILTIAVVLTVAALAGARILDIFGIPLDVFSVAGGIVLSFIGFTMLSGSRSDHAPDPATQNPDPSAAGATLAPMILFAASPGTITGVITIAAAHSRKGIPLPALTGICVVLIITWGLLLLVARRSKPPKGPSLAHDMVTRYMGLIVIAMGINYALTGYKAFMAG